MKGGWEGLEAYTQVSSHITYVENKHPDSDQIHVYFPDALFTYWNKASTAELMDFFTISEWVVLSLLIDSWFFLAN